MQMPALRSKIWDSPCTYPSRRSYGCSSQIIIHPLRFCRSMPENGDRRSSKRCRQVRTDFFSALTEYFSNSLAAELFCESCSLKGAPLYVEERIERLMQLLQPILPKTKACWRYAAAAAWPHRRSFVRGIVLSRWIYDRCDLCQGLKSGFMDPKRCFVLDARLLPRILPARSFCTVLGFMVGLIDDFSWPLWRDILLKASCLAKKRILFTVYTQKEAELIAKALGDAGWKGKVIDNRDSKGIYFQPVGLSGRKARMNGKVNYSSQYGWNR